MLLLTDRDAITTALTNPTLTPPALAAFDDRDEGLILLDPVSQLSLRQACLLTRLDEHLNEVAVIAAEDRLGHPVSRRFWTGDPSIWKIPVGADCTS